MASALQTALSSDETNPIVAAAGGAAPAAAPPPAGALAPAAAPAPGGLLGRVLGDSTAIRSAAAAQTSPAADAYDAEMAKTAMAKEMQAGALKDKMAATSAIMAEPTPEMPAVPRLEKLDSTPPVKQPDNPIKLMAQMLPIFAALGGIKTQSSAILALNASTAVLNALEANDQAAALKAHTEWKEHMGATLENNRIVGQEYTNLMNNRQMSWDDKMARIAAVATDSGDKIALAALASGDPGAILKRQEMLDKAAQQILPVYQHAQEVDLQRDQLDETNRHNLAAELNDTLRLQKEPTATMNNEIGRIAAKKAAGTEPLTAGETEVWETYNKWRSQGGGGGGGLGDLLGTGGGTVTVTKPPGGGAAPVTPPPAAAAAPPASKLKEGMVTTFENGQSWTLRGGKPQRVK